MCECRACAGAESPRASDGRTVHLPSLAREEPPRNRSACSSYPLPHGEEDPSAFKKVCAEYSSHFFQMKWTYLRKRALNTSPGS